MQALSRTLTGLPPSFAMLATGLRCRPADRLWGKRLQQLVGMEYPVSMSLRVLMVGATGLVGRLLADRLLEGGAEVESLARRASGRAHPAWFERIGPAETWPGLAGATVADVAVCALGTTMRAAGSKAAFRAVDFGLVVDFAHAARAAGVRRMIAVSSVGADPQSRNFYLRTKGEMEQALEGLGFERLDIVRPGLLRGPRGGNRRPGERIGILLSPLANLILRGSLDRYAAIDAETVAEAIARLAGGERPGLFRHHNRDLVRLASA
jgi:uncharacterized protein YbjT (DUF2867 family)